MLNEMGCLTFQEHAAEAPHGERGGNVGDAREAGRHPEHHGAEGAGVTVAAMAEGGYGNEVLKTPTGI